MIRRVRLPDGLTAALQALFPTLEWRRVAFFVGIRWPFSLGDEQAITLPAGCSTIGIYIRRGGYEPATHDFFTLCGHELVHALQVQSSPGRGKGLGLLNAFAFDYFTSFLRAWSAAPDRGNRYEDEAYAYEDRLHRALLALPRPLRLPCLPGGDANPSFAGAAALAAIDPRIVKREAEARGPSRGRALSLGRGRGRGAGRAAAADRWNAAGWTALGAGVGAFAGGPRGAAIGAAAGLAAGALDACSGVPSGIVAAALLAVGAIADGAGNAVLRVIGGRRGGSR